jgi:outer membrane assembly lipoprotein YfiO
MFRRFRFPAARLMVLCALALPLGAAAQDPMDFDNAERPLRPERKQPGFLRRAAKDTPAGQLAYANGLRDAGKRGKAMRAYAALVAAWHASEEALEAQLAYARLWEEKGNYARAFREYQYLIDFFAGQFPYQDVLDRQFRIANLMMTRRYGDWGPLPGFRAPERALPLFEQILENAPGGDLAAECRFSIGLIHEQGHDLDEAARAFEQVRNRHPDSPLAPEAAFRQASCRYRLALKSPRDDARCRAALAALAAFLRDYPDSPNRAEAQQSRDSLHAHWVAMAFENAAYYDRIARKPEAAVIAYGDFVRRFPLTEQAKEAQERIAALTQQIKESDHDESAPTP